MKSSNRKFKQILWKNRMKKPAINIENSEQMQQINKETVKN